MTLAETLITLGIIGVVAAYTIPTITAKFRENALLTQFFKVYTTISQAYVSAAQDCDIADYWAEGQAYDCMKPYLKISQDCPKTKGCFPNVASKRLKGIVYHNYYTNTTSNKVRLLDGTSILFGPFGSAFGKDAILVDINGDKPPNQWGHDLFILYLTSKSGAPAVIGYLAWADVRFCSLNGDSTGWFDGGSCSTWILKHRNMDYLHKNLTSADW